jgi:hypothetical protein
MDTRISIAGQAWMSQDTKVNRFNAVSDAVAPVRSFFTRGLSLQCVINPWPMVFTLQSFSLASCVYLGLSGATGIVGVT